MIGRETRERILSTCKVHGSDSDINIAAFHLLCNQLIELGRAEGRAEARKFMVQIFTDPENQPSQYGTVTLEYMEREIEAEREACEKKLEPVAWMLGDKFYKVKQCRFFSKNPGEEIPGQIPLYAAPPQHKPEQKPVAHCTLEQLAWLQRVVPSTGTIALYTAPPQREWVGLTEDQFLEASRLAEEGNYMVAFQRIQQWLKEKNT